MTTSISRREFLALGRIAARLSRAKVRSMSIRARCTAGISVRPSSKTLATCPA